MAMTGGRARPHYPPGLRRVRRSGLCLLAATATLFASFKICSAHPLGNDSVNHISVLWVLPDRLEFDLFLDFAEGPSTPFSEQIDIDRNGMESLDEHAVWVRAKAAETAASLSAALDGRTIPLQAVEQAHDPATGRKMPGVPGLVKIPGVMGLPTYKVLMRFAGRYPAPPGAGEHLLTYDDQSFGQYTGLKRIVLKEVPGVEVLPPHPEFMGPDNAAFFYDQYDPANLPQERSAKVRFRLAATAETAPAAGPNYSEILADPRNDPARASRADRDARRLIDLLQGRWGIMAFLTVTLLSFGWGAAHALAPGHAKTVVAAYLISRRGNYWHAIALALIVTVTHTALVIVVGLIIWAYQARHPAIGSALQLWLGVTAGLLVAGMGGMLVWRALTGRIDHAHHDHDSHPAAHDSWWRRLFTHSHPHPHPHTHSHAHANHVHDHPHDHSHDGPRHPPAHTHLHAGHEPAVAGDEDVLTTRTLLVLGITGGLVPCPTAMIILLLGIGANVVAGALYAVGVFSLGLALTLMLIGFLALSSRRFAARLLADARDGGRLSSAGRRVLLQAVPAASGALVVLLGLAIAANYLHYLVRGTSWLPWLG